jgi:hypothetical protein
LRRLFRAKKYQIEAKLLDKTSLQNESEFKLDGTAEAARAHRAREERGNRAFPFRLGVWAQPTLESFDVF